MHTSGFTLIELSIVLVIIGLIVGGILTGRDLVSAAAMRSQIAQIERYHQASTTFREKYGYLPGDVAAVEAQRFGFAARGPYAGQGDGNGIIEGINNNAANQNYGVRLNAGETALFWRDLSSSPVRWPSSPSCPAMPQNCWRSCCSGPLPSDASAAPRLLRAAYMARAGRQTACAAPRRLGTGDRVQHRVRRLPDPTMLLIVT